MRTATWFALFKRYGTRDWVVFAEKFGTPLVWAEYDETQDEEAKVVAEEIVANIGDDGQAVVSKVIGVHIDSTAREGKADGIHGNLIAYCNREMSKLVNGSTLANDNGVTLYRSGAHRLVVWRFVGDRIAEKPYLGWGLHATRRLPGRDADARHDPYYADILAVSPYHPKSRVPVTSVHPHNATLHIRVELGLPGMILYAALYCLVCLALLRRYSVGPGLAAGAAVITSAFVTGQLSFSVWQSWWLTTQFLAAALLLAMIRPWGTPQETTAESP